MSDGDRRGRERPVRKVESLCELRQLRGSTQEQIAELLGVAQPAVSKLERRCHPALSDVKYFVEALGGDLTVVARFPDGVTVEIRAGDDGPPSSR